MKILNILKHRQISKFHQVHISFENVLLLAKLNRWDWRRRCLLINVKPSNVLRPPVKEMMFDVVWSLQRRVAPQLSSSTFVSLSLLSCTKTSFSTNRTIKFDIALPVWSHPAITFQKRNYSFSTAAVNLLLLLSFFLREQLAEKSSFMGLAAGIGHTYWHFALSSRPKLSPFWPAGGQFS